MNYNGAVMIVWWLDLQLSMQSVPFITVVVSWRPAYGEVYSIQHYVIKFVSDDITVILLKVALNTITLTVMNYFLFFTECVKSVENGSQFVIVM